MNVLKRDELPLEIGKVLRAKIIDVEGRNWHMKVGKEEFWMYSVDGHRYLAGASFDMVYATNNKIIINVDTFENKMVGVINWANSQDIEEKVRDGIKQEKQRLEDNFDEKVKTLYGEGVATVIVRIYKDIEETYKEAVIEYLEDGRISIKSPSEDAVYEKDKFISVRVKKNTQNNIYGGFI